ncbi:MAG: multicopper oxidase family protein [Alphaproteobacteria bacterium]|nr:multicopper oxidase family protein [Alphaproteobacteria bacterium]
MHRRHFLELTAAAAAASLLPSNADAAAPAPKVTLTPGPARLNIVGIPHPDTLVWGYNGMVPGPILRARQGSRLKIAVRNKLAEPTTVHWHGLRVPNAMDGVPYVTQPPIAPGATFTYDIPLEDAGTFWYHPHFNSSVQVGRGLSGALIVDEPAPPRVDRDVIWVLDDWRLDRKAAIAANFAQPHDLTHAGRIGNTATVNGRVRERISVRAGERLRLRLINVANARTFGLKFEGLKPTIIALDGHPVTPHAPAEGMVVLGASQRADVILDMTGDPGSRTRVIDGYYQRAAYRLVDLAYASEPPLRADPPDWPIALKPNPLREPKLDGAAYHRVLLEGGAMSAMLARRFRANPQTRAFWFMNGAAMTEMKTKVPPLLTLKRGTSHVLDLVNDTRFEHPMHLHGHAFRVLSVNGTADRHRPWRDTVLVPAQGRARVALRADNPGDWMFHCHVLEHQAAGMMGIVRVV